MLVSIISAARQACAAKDSSRWRPAGAKETESASRLAIRVGRDALATGA